MTKNVADDPPPWMSFVAEWKGLSISGLRSEQDVREEVLAPMLRMLGYGGQTLNDILRAHPERLPGEYRMIGSRRIEVDYVPTLRLQRFWIMEAKKPGALNPDAFLQAHFYATYPSIAARYIVLADGEQMRLYDARATNFDEVRLVVQRDTAERDFSSFYQLLAARNIVDAIRRDVLTDVERVLAAEVDVNAPRSFASEIAVITRRVQPVIGENVRQLIITSYQKKAAERIAYLRSVDMRTLLTIMAYPTEVTNDTSSELARRLIDGGEDEQRVIVRAAMDAVERPARQTVRCGVMRAFLLAARDCNSSNSAAYLLASGVALARSNLSYAAEAPSLNATLHLENAVDRVAMKLVQHVLGDRAAESERLARQTATAEELIVDPPSQTYALIMYASGLAVNLWSALQDPDPEVVLTRIRGIEQFEQNYLPDPPPHLRYDQVLLGYKGREFDFLIRATVDCLHQIATSAPELLPDDLAEIGFGWDTSTFPSSPTVPDGDIDIHIELGFQASLQVLEQIRKANGDQILNETENSHHEIKKS